MRLSISIIKHIAKIKSIFLLNKTKEADRIITIDFFLDAAGRTRTGTDVNPLELGSSASANAATAAFAALTQREDFTIKIKNMQAVFILSGLNQRFKALIFRSLAKFIVLYSTSTSVMPFSSTYCESGMRK